MKTTNFDKVKNYFVYVREVHVHKVLVEAKDEEEAMLKVFRGDGKYSDEGPEYSHTLDSDTWTVKEDV